MGMVTSGQGRQFLAVSIGLALTVVIVAPIALSSQDLVRWAADPAGLGLSYAWAWLTFVALDAAAATCVGMTVYSSWRGEGGGAFHVLTWLFACGSALANYRHGVATPARDDEYFFPAMSLAGPLLLDVTLSKIRRWARVEARTQLAARPRFGMRWVPGVAFRETYRAWQAAHREGFERPADAIAYVREVAALAELSAHDAIRYAWHALGSRDAFAARAWLAARGVRVDQAALDAAAGSVSRARSVTPVPVPPVPVVVEVPAAAADLEPAPPLPVVDLRPAEAAAPVEVAEVEPGTALLTRGSASLYGSDIRTDLPEPASVPAAGAAELAGMTKRQVARLAFSTLGEWDVAAVRTWARERGVELDRTDVYAVRKAMQKDETAARRGQFAALPGGAR